MTDERAFAEYLQGLPERHKRLVFAFVCERKGHHWKRTGVAYMTFPPCYPEVCTCCGATRTASPQEPFNYSETKPAL